MDRRRRHMGSRGRNVRSSRRLIEPAMVAFTSLEPARGFAAIMVLAPLLLLLMLAMSSTTENPETQPEGRCRLIGLRCIIVGRITWRVPIVFARWDIPVHLIRLRISTATVISTACTQACQNHYQM